MSKCREKLKTTRDKWSTIRCLGCVHQEDCRTDKEKAEDFEARLEDLERLNPEEAKWYDYYSKPFVINVPAKLYEKLTWEKNHHLDYDIYRDRLEKLFVKIYNQLDKYKSVADEYVRLNKARKIMFNLEKKLILDGNDDFLKEIENYNGDLV